MPASDYLRIEKAIHYLDAHFRAQPSLKELAAQVHLSEYHFQRLFRRWAGISPKCFLQYLTATYTKSLLRASGKVLEVSHQVGLSGAGRLHDLMVHLHAVTPGEMKARGAGLDIDYGFHPSPFGDCLIAVTARGICAIEFIAPNERVYALAGLKAEWENAVWRERPHVTARVAARLFSAAPRAQPLRAHSGFREPEFRL